MRVVIFDGILETHLASSLERALVSLGHHVLNTGKLTHGFGFINSKIDVHRVNMSIDECLDFNPDLIMVFRPAALPHHLLTRLRASNSILAAWFSDDPVLWNLSYGHVVNDYDFVLHCGDSKILDFYEEKHGFATGVNFPFWTDGTAFPFVYGRNTVESDAIFLGNVSDKIRRNRYYTLAKLNIDLRAHGKMGDDYYNISGGYLDSNEEVVDAGSRARLAINIPQFFSDHNGLKTSFNGLENLGSFQYPSRVIQYAAMGLPTISLVPKGGEFETFPEILIVRSEQELEQRAQELLLSQSLSSLSERTYQRFTQNFSAGARALALESLVVDDSWRSQSSMERATWFTRFDGSHTEKPRPDPKTDYVQEQNAVRIVSTEPPANEPDPMLIHLRNHYQNPPSPERKLRLAVVGTGWGDPLSATRIASRSLAELGHSIEEINPFSIKHLVDDDPLKDFSGILDIETIYHDCNEVPDIFIFVGNKYIPDPKGVRILRLSTPVKFIAHAVSSDEFTRVLSKLSSLMDYVTLLNITMPDTLAAEGVHNVEYIPDLVDRPYIGLFLRQRSRSNRAAIIAQRSGHFQLNSRVLAEFEKIDNKHFCIEQDIPKKNGLASIARVLFSSITLVLPDYSRPGILPNRLLGHAFLSGGIPVLTRSHFSMTPAEAGVDCLVVGEPGDVALKFRRLLLDHAELDRMQLNAFDLGRKLYGAEERLSSVLSHVLSAK